MVVSIDDKLSDRQLMNAASLFTTDTVDMGKLGQFGEQRLIHSNCSVAESFAGAGVTGVQFNIVTHDNPDPAVTTGRVIIPYGRVYTIAELSTVAIANGRPRYIGFPTLPFELRRYVTGQIVAAGAALTSGRLNWFLGTPPQTN